MAGLTRRVLATSVKFDLLGRIEAPELGDGRPGAAATGLALPLPAPGKRLGKPRRLRWATSLQKSFGVDPLLDREGKRRPRRAHPLSSVDLNDAIGSSRLEHLAEENRWDVREADGLFAVVNGCPPDEGVMVELGMAIAWEKPVFLFRDDFRRCTDSEVYPLNLMLFTGLPAAGWEAAWYGSIEEIADPAKALARWLRHDRPPGTASVKADPIEV